MLVWPAVEVLVATAAVTMVAVAVALRPGAAGDPAAPGTLDARGRERRDRPGLGLLLVSDPSVTWTAGSVPALALLPSTIAGLWAGHSLWRLEQLIPRVVSGVAVGDSIAHGLRHGPLAGLLGAIARLLLLDGRALGRAAAHAVAGLPGRRAARVRAARARDVAREPAGGAGPRALGGRRRAPGRDRGVAGAAGVSRRAARRSGRRWPCSCCSGRRSRCWPAPPGRWRRRCGSHEPPRR